MPKVLKWKFGDPRSEQAHGTERVELKVLVSDPGHLPVGGEVRRVYYLDTPDRALYQRGVIVRLRRISGRHDDAVVKLRPMAAHSVPGWLHRTGGFTVELDALPGRFVRSGALKERLRPDELRRTLRRGRPPITLLSAQQRKMLAAVAPVRDDLLVPFGPVEVRKQRIALRGAGRAVTAEHWTYPDGRELLELSLRCTAARAEATAARLSAALHAGGIVPDPVQVTKTELALQDA